MFAGINWFAVLAAAIAGFALGAVWYSVLAKPWMAATGVKLSDIQDENGKMKGGPTPFIIAAVCQLLLASILAGTIGHMGAVTLNTGLITGFLAWLGFVMCTMLVNNSFAMRKPMQTVIDGGYWLVVFLVEGAIIGLFGVAASA